MKKNKDYKIFIIFALIFLFILSACGQEMDISPTLGAIIEETFGNLNIEPTNPINEDRYTLIGSFGFYKGSKNMSEIKTITFSHETPSEYDECWNANVANTSHIKGYRIGSDVVIVGDIIYANKRCSHMFAAFNSYGKPLWSNLVEINGLELLDTSYVEDMTMMFSFSKLTELNGISDWDVSNVKKFSGMFQGNSNKGDVKFTYLDVSKWDTSSAEDMSHVFYGCALMEEIPIENWDVSNVKTFSHMFADCYGLKSIDFSKWDTSSAESFDGFLNDCRSLVIVDVSNFNTEKCKQFSQMFESCRSLQYIIGLENWDVSNASVYAFSETFHCCYELKELNLGNWVASPDNTARMFKNCYKLERLDLSGFDMSNTKHDAEMFMNCNSLIEVIRSDKHKGSTNMYSKIEIRRDGEVICVCAQMNLVFIQMKL